MISPQAIVQTKSIGKNVRIDEFAIIRRDVVLGDGVVIHPYVVIESGAIIGDEVEIFPGAYIGKEPKGAGATARTIDFRRVVKIGKGSSIGPHAVVFYDVEIGENVLLGDGASIREQCRIGNKCLISRYVTVNYNTTIGDRVKIMDLSHMTGNMTIGNDVFISDLVSTANDNVMIGRTYEEEKILGPQIEDGASIGLGVSLLPAVRIGKGALVGAGSVVTKNVEPGTLVMGVPAKFIRNLG